MSKNLKIALGVIVILLGFIIINNIDFSSDIPSVKKIKDKIDAIEIVHEGKSIVIEKKDSKWLIGKEKYPADSSTVEKMVTKVKTIRITDLISKQAFYGTYDLTKEKGVSVTIKAKGQTKRKLIIGKKASTGRQSYIRYNDKKPVYMMTGATINDFKKTIDSLRDKKIFTLSSKAIKDFTIQYRGRSFTFYKKKVEVKNTSKSKTKGLKKPQKKKMKNQWFCKGYDNIKLSQSRLKSLMRNFSPLKAAAFTDDKKTSLNRATATITIKAFNKEINLKIFNINDKKQYRASSSESPYVFTLPQWRAKKFFLENIEKLKE